MDQTQAITLQVPGVLRIHSDGASRLAVSAPDVRGVLVELEQRFPGLHRNLCDETGKVRPHLNVYVNSEDVRFLNGLDTRLAAGDVVIILPAVSGG